MFTLYFLYEWGMLFAMIFWLLLVDAFCLSFHFLIIYTFNSSLLQNLEIFCWQLFTECIISHILLCNVLKITPLLIDRKNLKEINPLPNLGTSGQDSNCQKIIQHSQSKTSRKMDKNNNHAAFSFWTKC